MTTQETTVTDAQFVRDVWANVHRLDERINNQTACLEVHTNRDREHWRNTSALAERVQALEEAAKTAALAELPQQAQDMDRPATVDADLREIEQCRRDYAALVDSSDEDLARLGTELAALRDKVAETEWCVWYGGDEPDNAAGREVFDSEDAAVEKFQWVGHPRGVAHRLVSRGPWVIDETAAVEVIEQPSTGQDGAR